MEVSHRGSLGSAGLRPWALPGQRWIYTSRHFSWASRKIREDLHNHPYTDTGSPYTDTGSPYTDTGSPYTDTGSPYTDTGSPYTDTNSHYPDTNPWIDRWKSWTRNV
jgi:hypothetical protein